RSDPEATTAEPPVVALLLVDWLPLVLLQAAARAATATLSADVRSRAVLRALFITGSTPRRFGRNGDLAARRRRGGAALTMDGTVSGCDRDHKKQDIYLPDCYHL